MSDCVFEGAVRAAEMGFVYADVTGVVNEAVLRHDCDPLAAHLLGRAMAAGVLCSRGLGKGERLNVRWNYTGALRTLLVDAGYDGVVRGLVAPSQLGEAVDDREAVYGKSATINVVRVRGGEVLNSGTTESVFMGEVDDLAFYYCASEQVETSMLVLIALSSDPERPVRLCHGLLLQALPGCDLLQFQVIREALDAPEFRSAFCSKAEDCVSLPMQLNLLLPESIRGGACSLHEGARPVFACTCSAEKMTGVVGMVAEDERADVLEKGVPLRVRCHFCNEAYMVDLDVCREAWGL